MSKPTAKIELTHEEWVTAQELALNIESLVDGQEDELAEQLNPAISSRSSAGPAVMRARMEGMVRSAPMDLLMRSAGYSSGKRAAKKFV